VARRVVRVAAGAGLDALSVELRVPDYVVLVVSDIDRSLRFYVDLLGLPFGHRSGGFAQLATGATRVALYDRAEMGVMLGRVVARPSRDAPGFELGFKVDDVDAAYDELVAGGAEPVTRPTTRPWGQRTAYVADPDGHLVELAQDLPRQGDP
jgi:lactoylglutathione lyase